MNDLDAVQDLMADPTALAWTRGRPLRLEDSALLYDIIAAYNRSTFHLRLTLGMIAVNQADHMPNRLELNDTDLFIHAKKLALHADFPQANAQSWQQAIELLVRHHRLRHLLAHWIIVRAPEGEIMMAFTSDVKEGSKHLGEKWKDVRDDRKWDLANAAFRISDLNAILDHLQAASDTIGMCVNELSLS